MWPLTEGLRCLADAEADLFRGAVAMMVDQLVIELNASQDGKAPTLLDCEERHFELPHGYVMWEPDQRVWLVERVTTSLLTARSAPPASAIFEATIEAVYTEVGEQIAREITRGEPIEPGSWRHSLLLAYAGRCPKDSLMESLQFEATTLDPCLPPSITKHFKQLSDQDSQSLKHGESADADPAQADSESRRKPKTPIESTARDQDWLKWWSTVLDRLLDATYGPRLYHQAEQYRDGDPKMLHQFLQSKGVSHKFMYRIPPLRSPGQTQAAVDRIQTLVFHE